MLSDKSQLGRARAELLLSRFEPRGFLGEGAFGCVLRTYDRALETEVAFKELTRMGPAALLRFKTEFRSLTDVSHPNLVRLHELFEDAGRWAFTMELIDGPDFLGFVRDDGAGSFDEQKLRDALRQLTEGLSALHGLGLTHRDVKPSNVRVTRDGRVVLLDFGLVTPAADDASPNAGLGTLEYMAPEQARADRVGPAADFYALGVMLYEALTGLVPFEGQLLQVVLAKECQRPLAPSQRVPHVPPDLEALCMALLEPDPSRRAGPDDILQVLGQARASSAPRASASDLFVGRKAELERAHDVYLRMRHEGFQLLLIEGESGIGKTSLARAFADRLEAEHGPVLSLSGRCHAAEQLPFKLFDGIVDELSKRLTRLPASEAAALLPEHASALSTLFPVLAQITRLRRSSESAEFQRVERAQSFVLFVELLARYAQTQPLVFSVDDLQWADVDSMGLLDALLDSKAPPEVLMVVTTRELDSLEAPLGPLVRALVHHPRVSRLGLAPLSVEHASQLSARCLGTSAEDPRALRVAREAQGHPLFIAELAERMSSRTDEQAPTTLDDALRARLERLDPVSRRVLDLLAVSSAPVPVAVLAAALKAPGDELARALLDLRTARWARSARRGDLTCYHDRLREFARGLLPEPEVRAHHRLLAQAFRMRRDSDPAEVARHFLGAGEGEAALPWLERAAHNALEQQAFERAAGLFRSLIEYGASSFDAGRLHAVRLGLSDALSSAGRSAEAAAVLLEDLDLASSEERVEREGRAARQLLRAGQAGEGMMAARRALLGVGLSWPGSDTSALARLLWHRADIGVTGLLPLTRATRAESTAQLDALWGLWQPLGWADLLRGAELGARHLRLSLRAGDARHLGLALCSEALLGAMHDPVSTRPQRLLERAAAELARCQAPDLAAFHALSAGAGALFRAELALADAKLHEAELRFARDCPGEAWQLVNVRGGLLSMWMNRGDFRLGAAHSESWLLDARARGDSFAFATYSVTGYGALRHAMQDDPQAALDEIDAAMAPWASPHFGLQHFGAASARHVVLGYQSAEGPYEHWQRTWPLVRGSFLARAAFVRDILIAMRGESCIRAALVHTGSAQKKLLAEAQKTLSPLRHSPARLAQACYLSLQAQVELLEGRRHVAGDMAKQALAHWNVVGNLSHNPCSVLVAHLTASRREAKDTTERVVDWFAREGWQKPRRALRTWLPTLDVLTG